MQASLKTSFTQFLMLPKKSELPKIWGDYSPSRPPARTPMGGSFEYTIRKQCMRCVCDTDIKSISG